MRTTTRHASRARLRRVPGLDALEPRALLTLPSTLSIPLNKDLDQFGDQVVTVQGFETADGVAANGAGFGIFDTGASAVTFSPDDAALFDFFGNALPIKAPGNATASGIGGDITGDVSEPITVVADGLHASQLSFDDQGFPLFNFDFSGAARTDGIQTFVGTETGSPDLPTITGVPILEPSSINPNGLAAKVDMTGQVLDFSDIAPGLVLPFPDVHFVDPLTATLDSKDGVTDPAVIDLHPYGPDNYQDPGNDITSSPNVVIQGVGASVGTPDSGGVSLADKTFLFDTGAQISVISTATAEALGLDLAHPETTITVQGVGGSEDVPGFTLSTLDIPRRDGGVIEFTDLPVYVLDVAPDIDGILGMNALDTASQFLFNPNDPTGPSVSISFLTDPNRGDPTGGGDGTGDGNLLLGGGIPFGGAFHGSAMPTFAPSGITSTTTTAIKSVDGAGVFGAEETITVAVSTGGSATPGGSVALAVDGHPLGTATLDASGTAILKTRALGLGTHQLQATYAGAKGFGKSTSLVFNETLEAPHARISAASAPTGPTLGQAVELAASVGAVEDTTAKPSGTVTFAEGGRTLGRGSIDAGGVARFAPTGLGVGSHTITATYAGTSPFAGQVSTTFTVTVGKATPSVAVASDPSAASAGQVETLTATLAIAPGMPDATGSVEFRDGAAVIGTAKVDPATGRARLAASLGVGMHAVMAVYQGDGDYLGAASPAAFVAVTPPPGGAGGQNPVSTDVALGSSIASPVFGQAIALTATVTIAGASAPADGGRVVFMDGDQTLGSGPVSRGRATLDGVILATAGAHAIRALYSGGVGFLPSGSSPLSLAIGRASTRVSVQIASASGGKAGPSDAVATITVSALAPGSGSPSGTVAVRVGKAIRTARLDHGTATLRLSPKEFRQHVSISASFAGDASFLASQSASVKARSTRGHRPN